MHTEFTIDLGVLGERLITVEYNFTPGTPDVMYLPNGDPGYPGDPAELEIINVLPNFGILHGDVIEFLSENDGFFDCVLAIYEESKWPSEY